MNMWFSFNWIGVSFTIQETVNILKLALNSKETITFLNKMEKETLSTLLYSLFGKKLFQNPQKKCEW